MFSSDKWFGAEASFYNGVATQSLRFDDGSSAYLSRTPSTGNRKTWTLSFWLKKCDLGRDQDFLTSTGSGATGLWANMITSDDKLQVYGNNQVLLLSNQVLRDTSAWYNIIFRCDTTQSTASNRLKIYLNGSEITSFGTDNRANLTQDGDFGISSNVAHHIGANQVPGNYLDGYLAEYNFTDGVSNEPTAFGETKNGVWIPKKYSGSYGTNGFRLEFKQTGTGTASASTIGADTSGQNNHLTSTNLSAHDCVSDSPENNFATLNPLVVTASATNSYAEGNLQGGTSSTGGGNITGTMAIPSEGKWYYEFRSTTIGSGINLGLWEANASEDFFYQVTPSIAYLSSNGYKRVNNSTTTYGSAWNSSNTMGVAVDIDGGTVTFYRDNVSQGSISFDASGLLPVFGDNTGGSGCTARINFGQDSTFSGEISSGGNADANGIGDFAYAPPSGYLALCTANLPEPTISPNSDTQADDHFNTVLFSGTGSSPLSVTGVGFQPDLLWLKRRNGGTNGHHILYDSIRGGTNALRASNNTAQSQFGDMVITFASDGFSFTGTDGLNNSSSYSNVAWNWKANGGTTSSNTDGSITSTVQANQTAGFSIVTYEIDSSGAKTIGHGLTQAPQLIINKGIDQNASWWTFTTVIDGTLDYVRLNDTNAKADDSLLSLPSSTTFGMVENYTLQQNAIAYCFHSVEGYSKIGSYTGNGSEDGAFVYTGFRPAFLLMKRTDATGYWGMWDTVRDVDNSVIYELSPNAPDAETTAAGDRLDILSNGFKLRHDGVAYNASGSPIIYMAFAENPFKYANAR